MSKNAYVTFIIRNDSYLPGALVFAYALRKQETHNDLICIVSDNISEKAIASLKTLYDDVVILEELYVKHDRRQERQDRPFLFSRFNAFRLGKDGDLGKQYDKIIIADCDLLPIQGYDTLFELEAPAGIINEKKEYCVESQDGAYYIPESAYQNRTWKWHEVYHDIPHGKKIPKDITDRITTDPENMGVNASLMLFQPTMQLYNSILHDMNDSSISQDIAGYSWPEMQYITLKMSGKWTNIDLKYSSFNGYPMIDILYGIHYAGLKPWNIKNKSLKTYGRFEDYQLWFYVFLKMLEEYPSLRNGKLSRIEVFLTTLLDDKKYRFAKTYLNSLQHLVK